MRRTAVLLTASVALLALLAGAGARAASTDDFGTLLTQGEWTVGTVDGQRDTYCATVNALKAADRADDVVLAVARDTTGYGSLAFDFTQKFFKAGETYDATVTPAGQKPQTLKAKATTEKSLIIQIGNDDEFFKGMGGGTLDLKLPQVKARFALGAFDKAYGDLQGCVTELAAKTTAPAATAVASADMAGKAAKPVDAIAAGIAAGKDVKVPAASVAVAANPLDVVEAELEKATQAEKAAKAEQEKVAAALEAQKKEVAALESQKQKVERKLLMSSSSAVAALPLAPSPAAAQPVPKAVELEKQQIAAIKEKPVTPSPADIPAAPEANRVKTSDKTAAALALATVPPAAAAPPVVAAIAEKPSQAETEKPVAITPPAAAPQPAAPVAPVVAAADPVVLQKYEKLSGDLEKQQKAMATLEAQLQQIQKDREAEAARAKAAQEELEKTRKQLAELKSRDVERMAETRIENDKAVLAAIRADSQTARNAPAAEQLSAASNTGMAMPEASADDLSASDVIVPPPAVVPVRAKTESKPAQAVTGAEVATGLRDQNKAEAFLDRILAAHRIRSKPSDRPALPPALKAPVEKSAATTSRKLPLSASRRVRTPDSEVAQDIPVSAAAAVAATAVTAQSPQGAGGVPVLPVVAAAAAPAAAKAEDDGSFFGGLKKVFGAGQKTPKNPDFPDAGDIPVFAGGGITLEKLLGYSGTSRVNFKPSTGTPGMVARQWSSDNFDGLYEQSRRAASMQAQVDLYIDRYRADCPRDLSVSIKDPRPAGVGMLVLADIVCTMRGNSYATSFVFAEDEFFHAIMHTGYPQDQARLKQVAANIALTLSRASRFLAPQPALQKPMLTLQPGEGIKKPAATVTPTVADTEEDAPLVITSTGASVGDAPAAPKLIPQKIMRDVPDAVSTDEFGTVVIE